MADLGVLFRAPKRAFARAAEVVRGLVERATRSRESDEVLEGVAQFAEDRLKQGILNGQPGWPPLSEMTKDLKGHGKPLVDSGEFVEGITHWKQGGVWHAGLPPWEDDLQRIGDVHEHGAFIAVTQRMRGWFLAQGYPLKASTQYVRVPARPWFAPAKAEVEAHAKAEIRRLQEVLAERAKRDIERASRDEARQIAAGAAAGVARARSPSRSGAA